MSQEQIQSIVTQIPALINNGMATLMNTMGPEKSQLLVYLLYTIAGLSIVKMVVGFFRRRLDHIAMLLVVAMLSGGTGTSMQNTLNSFYAAGIGIAQNIIQEYGASQASNK